MEPKISLQTVTGTFDGTRDENRDRILAPDIVEFLGEQPGAGVLSIVLDVEGDIPAEGVEVVINSDGDFSQYFTRLGRQPFSLGGEVLEAVYAPDGTPVGIKVLVTGPNALFSFTAVDREEAETDGAETLTFSLGDGDGYTVDADASASTITFYDTLADVPAPGSTPTVGISIDNTELVESEGSEFTVTFNVDGDIPENGLLVYVDSGTRAALGELNIFEAEVNGGVFPPANFASSGFYFKILEDGASIKLNVFDETTNPSIDPADAVEGIESFNFSLIEGPGYSINGDASSISYSIADEVDSVPLVSFSVSPEVLAESEGTVSIHNFTVSTEPPAEGIVVTVSAPNLSEFDLSKIAVMGGEIVGVNGDGTGFDFKIVEQNATIELPIANDGETEGIESAVFTLEPGTGYLVNPSENEGTFILSDEPVVAPPTDEETNDTIATAVATGLTAENNSVSISGELDQQRTPAVDRTEDVDMYSVELGAGDVLRINTDARSLQPSPLSPDTVLRVFDESGNQLAQSDDDFAPDELFAPGRQDSYIEYTAEVAGTYYVGVSSFPNGEFGFNNDPYLPEEVGSGAGRSYGEYNLNLSLNKEFTSEATVIPPSTGDGPVVSISGTPGTYDGDDNLLASALVQFVENDSASILTLGLNVEGTIPEEGVEVFVKSDVDLSSVFSTRSPFSPNGAEVLGAIYDDAGNPVGLRVNLTSNTAILNLNLDSPDEAPTDGTETINFTLEPSTGYTVGANTISTPVYDILEDVPEQPTVPTVGISVSETALVESEGNLTTVTFTLDTPPPAEGVLVNLESGFGGALGEFDVFNAEISGGDFPAPNFRASGFFFRITEQTATITLAAFDETSNPEIPAEDALEGIEELTFTVQPGVGYAISPDANEITFTIADNPDSVVITPDDGDNGGDDISEIPFETEFNDTIADATDTELSVLHPNFTMNAEIDSIRSTRNLVDATEDVDMYAFEMQAGDTVKIDIDSIPYQLEDFEGEQAVDTELRIFNSSGEELVLNTEAPAPGELFESGRDAYVEFTATEAGTYYAGVALLSNRAYDPNVQASGSGRVFPTFGINTGEYTIDFSLDAAALRPTIVGTDGDDNIAGTGANDVFSGGAGNDNLYGNGGDDSFLGGDGDDGLYGSSGNDIFIGGDGSDRMYGNGGNDSFSGGMGNDIVFGGSGDDVAKGGAGDDIFYGNGGNDSFMGDDGNDELYGSHGNDELDGGAGDDIFYGNGGQDIFMGGAGDDKIYGGNDSDVVFAGEGDDIVYGNAGRDVLSGDAGDDKIWAGDGDDVIMGVTGNDTLVGGNGSDLFVFGNGDGTDIIEDFHVGTDKIGLVEGELTFADLSLTQDGSDTLLGVSDTEEVLAVLKFTDASAFGEDSFAVVPDVSNPDEALSIV